jgi:hypothetical protein
LCKRASSSSGADATSVQAGQHALAAVHCAMAPSASPAASSARPQAMRESKSSAPPAKPLRQLASAPSTS